MSRRKGRAQAFLLIFEKSFSASAKMPELISLAQETKGGDYDHVAGAEDFDPFAEEIALNIESRLEEIDGIISAHSLKWAKNRISRVALAALRLALYEILYIEGVPQRVSINEAVELAKKFGGEDDPAFINGILGSIVRVNEAEATGAETAEAGFTETVLTEVELTGEENG
jgi:N utilization substance protein B